MRGRGVGKWWDCGGGAVVNFCWSPRLVFTLVSPHPVNGRFCAYGGCSSRAPGELKADYLVPEVTLSLATADRAPYPEL